MDTADPCSLNQLVTPAAYLEMRCNTQLAMQTAQDCLGKIEKEFAAVFNRNVSFGAGGIFAQEIRAALCNLDRHPRGFGYVAGFGGAFDIGYQSLSGAVERNEDCIFVCYNNEAYMNTGVQRSSATPYGTRTTTTPAKKWKKTGMTSP